jgi:hypothetical protein
MWFGAFVEEFVLPTLRDLANHHVYLILFLRSVLALRVLRVVHLTKRSRSMKVSTVIHVVVHHSRFKTVCAA